MTAAPGGPREADDCAAELIRLARQESYQEMSAITATLLRPDRGREWSDVVRSLVRSCARTVAPGAPATAGGPVTRSWTGYAFDPTGRLPVPARMALRALLAELDGDRHARDHTIQDARDGATVDRVDLLGHLLRWIRDADAVVAT